MNYVSNKPLKMYDLKKDLSLINFNVENQSVSYSVLLSMTLQEGQTLPFVLAVTLLFFIFFK